jgi:hypothetical protein
MQIVLVKDVVKSASRFSGSLTSDSLVSEALASEPLVLGLFT